VKIRVNARIIIIEKFVDLCEPFRAVGFDPVLFRLGHISNLTIHLTQGAHAKFFHPEHCNSCRKNYFHCGVFFFLNHDESDHCKQYRAAFRVAGFLVALAHCVELKLVFGVQGS
jgi:hypothetical protein